ncbi:MLP-like protein 43 [Chenopodium quinoa]|uniref:Bet v I/Major latex protein domain-containing protein n=2 Tax=Chenopodium quinoa TaxID=63459 RepID=A0A803N8S9_CHEQI|nr:MLP-like protein 43 [Chenopodium quinoa]XP_021745405.1 MLP-like protein 43 [Chenopodium quinoa]XP_021749487.1 MLP-like protein 43 [Chenopodium quinoa]
MAGLKRKLEGEIEIRVAGGDAFHELFQEKPHDIANIHPEFVQGCDLHHGSFGKPGSKICWNYTLDGKVQKGKQVLDVVDEKNKIIKFRMLEGDLMEDYNTFVITYQVIPKGEELSLVTWTFEYEKKHPGVPEPSSLMDELLKLAKEIDDHHHRQDK